MDDIEIITESSFIKDKLAFHVSMIQNINEFYIKKTLENKYVNKVFNNIYIKYIKNIQYSNEIYQNINDNNYIIDVQYSIVGVRYFKDMILSFTNEHIINVSNQYYFKKQNIIALVNNIVITNNNVINNIENAIVVVKVIKDPEFMVEDKELQIGLICELVKIIENNEENKKEYIN